MKILTPIIEKHITQLNEKRKTERSTKKEYFYATDGLVENPSDSKCPRRIFYEFSDAVPEPLDIGTLKKFAIGEALHTWIQDILIRERKAEVIEDYNVEYHQDMQNPDKTAARKVLNEKNKIIIKVPVEIHGRMDAQMRHEEESIIVEIKTINKGQFFYLKENPKENHKLQIQFYLDNKGIKKGIILYICKDTGDFKEFLIEHDPEYVKKAKERFAALKEKIDKGELPERPYPIGDWHCTYCNYKKGCWKPKEDAEK